MSDEKIKFDLGEALINACGESYLRHTYARYSPTISNLVDPVLRKFNRLFPDKSACPPDLKALIDDYINTINRPVEPILNTGLDELAQLIKKAHESNPVADSLSSSEQQSMVNELIQNYISQLSRILSGGGHSTLKSEQLAKHFRLIQNHKKKILTIKTPSLPLNAESLLSYHHDLTKLIDNYNKELAKANPPKQEDTKKYKRLKELQKLMEEYKSPHDALSLEWMKLIEEYEAELVKLRPPKETSLNYKADVILHYLARVDKQQKEAHRQVAEATIVTEPDMPHNPAQANKQYLPNEDEFKKILRQELPVMLPLKKVLEVLSISRSSLYRGIQKGIYPKGIPVTDGDTVRWERESIINALALRVYP